MRQARPSACLSDFALDHLLIGLPATGSSAGGARRHLSSCERCTERLAAFAAVQPPAPPPATEEEATWLRSTGYCHALEATRPGHQSMTPSLALRLQRWLVPAGAALVVLGVVLMFLGRGALPGRDGLSAGIPAGDPGPGPGRPLLHLSLRHPSGERLDMSAVRARPALRSGDHLAISGASPRSLYVVVVSLRAGARVQLFPEEMMRLSGPGSGDVLEWTVPGSGVERVMVLVCEEALLPERLRSWAMALATGAGDAAKKSRAGEPCTAAIFPSP